MMTSSDETTTSRDFQSAVMFEFKLASKRYRYYMIKFSNSSLKAEKLQFIHNVPGRLSIPFEDAVATSIPAKTGLPQHIGLK